MTENIILDSKSKQVFLFKNKTEFEKLSRKGWLYFFQTKPHSVSETTFYIKYGLTERTLKERFSGYDSLSNNIYGIPISCDEVYIREKGMKNIFNLCKQDRDINIWKCKGIEYLKGTLELMLKVFLYFAFIDIEKAKEHSDNFALDKSQLVSWLETLPLTSQYSISPYDVNDKSCLQKIIKDNKVQQKIVFSGEPYVTDKINDNSFVCTKCGKKCKDQRGLSIHLNGCEGVQNLTCVHCNEHFANPYSLSVHLNRCKVLKQQKLDTEIETNQNSTLLLETIEEKNQELKLENQELKLKLQNILTDKDADIIKLKESNRQELLQEIRTKDADIISLTKQVNNLEIDLKLKDLKIESLTQQLEFFRVRERELFELYAKSSPKNTTIINQDNRICIQWNNPSLDDIKDIHTYVTSSK